MLPTLIDDPRYYDDKVLTPEEILGWFDVCDAGWMHNNDPNKPHAELTSGKCSNGFFDCLRVFSYPNLCEIFGRQLAKRLMKEGIVKKIDWVVSSAYAAINFGQEVAKGLRARFGFTEKDPADSKKQVWQRLTIPKGANVLQIEELITTSGTFREVHRAVAEGNSEKQLNFLSVVGTLIHRPPKLPADYGDRKVVALIEKEVWAVERKDCPLCTKGSPRLRPKTYWKELTGKA